VVDFEDENYPLQPLTELPDSPPKPVNQRYGIPLRAMRVVEDHIQPSQALSSILSKYNVSPSLIGHLVNQARAEGIFDVRKIKENNKYTLLCSEEESSQLTARYFIYEPSPLDYVVLDFVDSVAIAGTHKIDTVQKTFAGIVDYSVYQTLREGNAPTDLIYKLSDVFAWQIDPFNVQKGDRFKVYYEEMQVNGEPIGLGKVIAAYFEHEDYEFYGFNYDQNSDTNYFDENGNSLRKAFLKAPLSYTYISSRFSQNRLHPILKIHRPHHGIDYAAPEGTPVRAIGDGVIVYAGYNGGAGHMVKVKHNSVYVTGYLHLSRYGKGIRVGSRVKQGDIIGYVGSSGLSTSAHLHFHFWENGNSVDPLKVKLPPSEPIKKENLEDFQAVVKVMKNLLDTVEYNAPREENEKEEKIILASTETHRQEENSTPLTR
jgi:murein DD-endopeptidase MepM/ murein hydrolase activator NlpD